MSNVLEQIAKHAGEETCDTKLKDIATQTVIENDIIKKSMEQIKDLHTENKKLKESLSREKEEKGTVKRIFTKGNFFARCRGKILSFIKKKRLPPSSCRNVKTMGFRMLTINSLLG
uniref:Uncharacterized protein LOC114328168 n=1 Tax=Diabrotica virgifera virgifera TaxID=50390 RepID=A0A6P7FHS0_DIAVI